MITIIKNVEVYSPHDLGQKDIVITGHLIEGLYDHVSLPNNFIEINVIDGKGKIAVPGFIDSHVHILGEGGEGGFHTRTPEIQLTEIISSGITTVIGCLGTDGVCRSLQSLFAKAMSLEEEGISTYIYSGSYEIPVKTITGDIKSDILFIDKVIGIGEIALSDHRSSQPSYQDFVKIVADARLGGILSGKAGIVNVHIGDGNKQLDYLKRLIDETEIPVTQLLPTHINRNKALFNAGVEFSKYGGLIDLTTSITDVIKKGVISASAGLRQLLEKGVPIEQIQFTSDGQGGLPRFNEKKELIGLGVGSVASLFAEVRKAVLDEKVSLENAIKTITSNVADHLKLKTKGILSKGKDADIVVLKEDDLKIEHVFAKGQHIIKNGNPIISGTFEIGFDRQLCAYREQLSQRS
jgi:beta-aspartyl-dipeptidase (metallo-type)